MLTQHPATLAAMSLAAVSRKPIVPDCQRANSHQELHGMFALLLCYQSQQDVCSQPCTS